MDTPGGWGLFAGWLLKSSAQAALLVVLVLAVQWLLRRRLTPQWRYFLWWPVVARLLMPVSLPGPVSIFNWIGWRGSEPMGRGVEAIEIAPQPDPSMLAGTEVLEASAGGRARLLPSLPVNAESTEEPRLGRSLALPGKTETSRPVLPFPWRLAVMWLWLAGAALLGARLVWSVLHMRRELRTATPVDDPTVLALLDECRERMRVRDRLTLLETPLVNSPALCGFWRPKLLLPPGLCRDFTAQQLRFIFLHELAHVRRHDIAVNWLITLLQLLHWFNPFVWLAFSRLRADRELACDALALSMAAPGEQHAYGQTIIRLLEDFARPSAMPGLVGILEDRNQMKRRIRMIAQFRRPGRWAWLSGIAAAILGIVCLTDAQTRNEKESDAPAANQTTKAASTGTNAIAIGNHGREPQALFTRWFKLEPSVLPDRLYSFLGEPLDPNPTNTTAALRRFFARARVELDWPKSIEWTETSGLLMVRATKPDLDRVEDAIQLLKRSPDQLVIRVQVCEVAFQDGDLPELGKILGVSPERFASANAESRLTNAVEATPPQVLTEVRLKEVLRLIMQRPDMDFTAVSRVVTLSGRQAQINIGATTDATTGQSNLTTGVSVEATVLPDGTTIKVQANAMITTLIGYDTQPVHRRWYDYVAPPNVDPGQIHQALPSAIPERPSAAEPSAVPRVPVPGAEGGPMLPVYRGRQTVAKATVWDGQTMVLSRMTSGAPMESRSGAPATNNLPLVGRFFRSESFVPRNSLVLIFITPTIIDPAGNRVHGDNDLPFARTNVPPQRGSYQRQASDWTSRRTELIERIERIRLPRVGFNNVPLPQVIQELARLARQHDPEHRGMNFLLSAPIRSERAPSVNSQTGLPEEPTNVPPDEVLVSLAELKDVTLQQALDAVAKGASQPIRFQTEYYAVVCTTTPASEVPPLFTRWWKVDLNRFARALAEQDGGSPTNRTTETAGTAIERPTSRLANAPVWEPERFRRFFKSKGFDITPPRQVYYNDRLGMLMIRATEEELERIEIAIAPYLAKPAAQGNPTTDSKPGQVEGINNTNLIWSAKSSSVFEMPLLSLRHAGPHDETPGRMRYSLTQLRSLIASEPSGHRFRYTDQIDAEAMRQYQAEWESYKAGQRPSTPPSLSPSSIERLLESEKLMLSDPAGNPVHSQNSRP